MNITANQYKILFFIALICVFVASLLPNQAFVAIKAPSNTDKLIHFSMYFVLSVLSVLAWGNTKKSLFIIALSLISCGFCIEILQGTHWIKRSYDIVDEIFNSIGVLAGLLIFLTRNKLVKSVS